MNKKGKLGPTILLALHIALAIASFSYGSIEHHYLNWVGFIVVTIFGCVTLASLNKYHFGYKIFNLISLVIVIAFSGFFTASLTESKITEFNYYFLSLTIIASVPIFYYTIRDYNKTNILIQEQIPNNPQWPL